MKKLDLHGTKHADAKAKVIRFLESNWGSGKQVEIITGNSIVMRSIVVEVLSEYQLECDMTDLFGFNNSRVTTIME